MQKLWQGRFEKGIDGAVNDFNSSISFDRKLYREDIKGSIVHVTMLKECKIIPEDEADQIVDELGAILQEIDSGKLAIDENAEDIHSFVEAELTKRLPVAGKKLHTARSRNDQVALDLRMWVAEKIDAVQALLKEFVTTLTSIAEQHTKTILSGYTHLQKAQPVTFAHHLMAYAAMFLRDIERLKDAKKRVLVNPLGSGALATTTYNINRKRTTELLGFLEPSFNSMDGVSDRDYCVEYLSALSLIMMHLSRFSEEIILWSSWEFKYIELDDAYSTGSSIMPQKKNPDIAELARGKSGRVFGSLFSILTVLKGTPLAYNKDMQEDKEAVFDATDTVMQSLGVFIPMLKTMKVLPENMRLKAAEGFINATDCADYLVGKGLPFRDAYKITGKIVAYCIKRGKTLETLKIKDYKRFSDLFDEKIYDAVNLENCVNGRKVYGGPSEISVKAQIKYVLKKVSKE